MRQQNRDYSRIKNRDRRLISSDKSARDGDSADEPRPAILRQAGSARKATIQFRRRPQKRETRLLAQAITIAVPLRLDLDSGRDGFHEMRDRSRATPGPPVRAPKQPW